MAIGVALLFLVAIGGAIAVGWGLGTRQERARLARYVEVSAPPPVPGRRRGVRMTSIRFSK